MGRPPADARMQRPRLAGPLRRWLDRRGKPGRHRWSSVRCLKRPASAGRRPYALTVEPSKGRSGLGLLGFAVLAIALIVVVAIVAASFGHQLAIAEKTLEQLPR